MIVELTKQEIETCKNSVLLIYNKHSTQSPILFALAEKLDKALVTATDAREEPLSPEDFDRFYRDEHNDIPNFNYIVKKNLGILNNPKADALINAAWERGHAYGYYEVYNIAQDLLELIV